MAWPDGRRGTLFVLEDDLPPTRPRWFCHWDGTFAPGFENLDGAVRWGLERARTVIVRTLGGLFYQAGDRPADSEDYDLEGGLRAWPPSVDPAARPGLAPDGNRVRHCRKPGT